MTNLDPNLKRQVRRLHQLTVGARWLFVAVCWMTLGSFGIWGLREEIPLWQEHFTWVAVRYAIAFNRIPALCLAFCIGVTAAVLVWQNNHRFGGLSVQEKQRLEKEVRKIHAIGPRHPLWKWIK
ncbi:hypothetical protein NIES593_06395 [Hydrococcus rivularis NIES-593]|uniref:Uncharacterized protein n=1 Tax=Hydrococcus rivularis NIES-593 TaxID=1921803 RepID=A0A1U7HMQ8_9CYAN|nr:hypothetical protein [Hydrococcus rivularis]OKH24841.1 hypothetical protein NIES593_06395 [Hydrococcus rivularis NIES-593]